MDRVVSQYTRLTYNIDNLPYDTVIVNIESTCNDLEKMHTQIRPSTGWGEIKIIYEPPRGKHKDDPEGILSCMDLIVDSVKAMRDRYVKEQFPTQ